MSIKVLQNKKLTPDPDSNPNPDPSKKISNPEIRQNLNIKSVRILHNTTSSRKKEDSRNT